jgi:hypothetical protein
MSAFDPKQRPFKAQEAFIPHEDISDAEFRKSVISVCRDIQEIKTALIGNELGTPGLFPRVENVERTVQIHERRFLIWGTALTVIGVVLSTAKDTLVAIFAS